MRRWLVALLVGVAVPVLAQDADRLARARWPDTFVRPAAFVREEGERAIKITPELRGQNALLRPNVAASVRDLAEFDRLDHVAIVRFIPSGDGIEITYGGEQGDWSMQTRGGEMFMTTGDALEYRAPLVPGWNVLEFRCGMQNADTLDRSMTIKLNEATVGRGRLDFNGRLRILYMRTNGATAVLANGGFEIGETRRVDQARPRGR